MMDGVKMYVLESSKKRTLESYIAVPVLIPNSPARFAVDPINLASSEGMKMPYQPLEVAWFGRRQGNKMIVVRQNSPGLEVPFIMMGKLKELA